MIFSRKAIVANTGDDTLTYVALKDQRVIETIDLKTEINDNTSRNIRLGNYNIGPYHIASNGRGSIYCTNVYDNSILKMDLASKQIIDIISVGSYPSYIRYFNGYLFITNSDSNSISVIDEKNFSLVENIPVGERPTYIEIDEDNMDMYVVNSNSHSINVIDLKRDNNRIIKLISNPVKISIVENLIYILLNTNNGIINNSNISILDLKTHKKRASNDFKGIFSDMMKISGSEIIFITSMDNGYLYRINLKDQSLINKFYLTGMPNKLEWDGENTLFITNISTNSLTLFDIKSNKIIGNIEVGVEPNGILIFN